MTPSPTWGPVIPCFKLPRGFSRLQDKVQAPDQHLRALCHPTLLPSPDSILKPPPGQNPPPPTLALCPSTLGLCSLPGTLAPDPAALHTALPTISLLTPVLTSGRPHVLQEAFRTLICSPCPWVTAVIAELACRPPNCMQLAGAGAAGGQKGFLLPCTLFPDTVNYV